MKRTFWLIALVVAFSTTAVWAGEKQKTPAKKKPQPAATQKKKVEKVAVTGSYIKKPVGPEGVVADGPSPTHIITAREISESGTTDLVQLMLQKGYRR